MKDKADKILAVVATIACAAFAVYLFDLFLEQAVLC